MQDTENERGIVFPRGDDGKRSTTLAGAQIVAAALQPLSERHASDALAEPRWRRAYPEHFRRLTEGALRSPEGAVASARAGLAASWQGLRWAGPGGEGALADAMAAPGQPLVTATLQGRGDARPAAWQLPYRGAMLSGSALLDRIAAWQAAGVIEASCARALRRCTENPDWFDLSDRHLVLLGAASEAGPLSWLARWRANLVAVDIDRPGPWRKIIGCVLAGNARLHLPVSDPARRNADGDALIGAAGADLLIRTPEIAAWLAGFDARLDIASLAYLDGERHLRVSLAMDAIVDAACKRRPDTSLAYLATPTDVFAVPAEAARAAMAAFRHRAVASRMVQGTLRLAAGDSFFAPNVEALVEAPGGLAYGIVDSLVIEQGPNYALAKRLQQWRALAARDRGHRVSLNVAPSTTTASVVRNPALAAGFAGANAFGIEVFEPETTNALMAALWVHDLRSAESAADPSRTLAHPLELFMDNAAHGGLWRGAYLPRTALPFAALLGWTRSQVRLLSGRASR